MQILMFQPRKNWGWAKKERGGRGEKEMVSFSPFPLPPLSFFALAPIFVWLKHRNFVWKSHRNGCFTGQYTRYIIHRYSLFCYEGKRYCLLNYLLFCSPITYWRSLSMWEPSSNWPLQFPSKRNVECVIQCTQATFQLLNLLLNRWISLNYIIVAAAIHLLRPCQGKFRQATWAKK